MGGARAVLRGETGLWLSIFGVSLGLFLVRFLVPTPVGQADNRDGPRLLCGLGLEPTHPLGTPRFYRFAYFEYRPNVTCAHRLPYPSSELVPLEITKWLTPVFGLPGTLNLLLLGGIFCVLSAAGIASLALGLRVRLWARLLIAAITWLIVADAAFFDVFASPFSEPAALVGLLLVAAGLLYLGQDWHATLFGLALTGTGGFLAILSKEQYLVFAVPICVVLVLASGARGQPWRTRFATRQTVGAAVVAALLGVMAAGYWAWDYSSGYGQRLEHIQAVDMIFTDIVTKQATAPAQLHALGLPESWARYAGRYYWDRGSVRLDPLYLQYAPELTDSNIAHFLLTHPGYIVSIGQKSAQYAQLVRVTTLGDFPPDTGHPKGAVESRLVAFTWLAHQLPAGLGLWLYLPLWAVMAALAVMALRSRRARPWYRDGAAVVLCMVGCAVLAFIPPAYFAGISTTRHMVGTNLATALALVITVALVISTVYQALTGPSALAPGGPPESALPEMAEPVL